LIRINIRALENEENLEMIFSRDSTRGYTKTHLVWIFSQDPGDDVDIVDQAIVEDAARYLQIFDAGQGRVARDGFDHVNVSDFASANATLHIQVRRIESPIKRAEQRLADLLGDFVAFGGIRTVLRYRLLAEDGLLRLQCLDDDILVRECRRRDDHCVDATQIKRCKR